MAQTVTSIRVQALLSAAIKLPINSGAENTTVKQELSFEPETTLATGTIADTFDRIWVGRNRSLNSGNSEDIDIFDLGSIDIGAGAGKDAAGQAWAAAEIVAVLIQVTRASAGALYIGGKGTAAAWQSIFHSAGTPDDSAGFGPLGAGGCFFIFQPVDPAWVVVDSTNHLLKIAAVGGNCGYSIALAGRSA